MSSFRNTCSFYKVCRKSIFNIEFYLIIISLYPPYFFLRCWVSGWGKDAFGTNGKYQSITKEVDVPIVDQSTCENALRQTRLGRSFMLNKNSFICAGGEQGKDACTVSY